jgi:hypothetical protein
MFFLNKIFKNVSISWSYSFKTCPNIIRKAAGAYRIQSLSKVRLVNLTKTDFLFKETSLLVGRGGGLEIFCRYLYIYQRHCQTKDDIFKTLWPQAKDSRDFRQLLVVVLASSTSWSSGSMLSLRSPGSLQTWDTADSQIRVE